MDRCKCPEGDFRFCHGENDKLRAEVERLSKEHAFPMCLTFEQMQHATDKIRTLEFQVESLQKALHAHHWHSDCLCVVLKVNPCSEGGQHNYEPGESETCCKCQQKRVS